MRFDQLKHQKVHSKMSNQEITNALNEREAWIIDGDERISNLRLMILRSLINYAHIAFHELRTSTNCYDMFNKIFELALSIPYTLDDLPSGDKWFVGEVQKLVNELEDKSTLKTKLAPELSLQKKQLDNQYQYLAAIRGQFAPSTVTAKPNVETPCAKL